MVKYFSKVAAAILAVMIITGFALNAFMPVYARNLPFVGNAFAFIQDRLHTGGAYSNYAFEIGDKVTDNGITITMSEAYCDGVNLYVSFVVESENAFDTWTTDGYINSQLNYDGTMYIESTEGRKSLDDFGLTGLEGKFTDAFTFVGVKSFTLKGDVFPDKFMLDMEIKSVSLITGKAYTEYVKGDWHFAPSINVNSVDVVTYEINKEAKDHTIDKVVVTPIYVTIYTSYPDIYGDTTSYEVRAYTDGHIDEDISSQGEYGRTSGITQIPRIRVNNELHIYVVNGTTLCEDGLACGAQKASKEHAIVSADITIDK
ncbi:MAG: DUF4179 domain-containing protein [Peptoanaerobacter stomatis]